MSQTCEKNCKKSHKLVKKEAPKSGKRDKLVKKQQQISEKMTETSEKK